MQLYSANCPPACTRAPWMGLRRRIWWALTCSTPPEGAGRWSLRLLAERMVELVLDNLNIHSIGSLYAAFPPAEAKRLANKREIHYTPKHGSWLNMAEIEASVLRRQCLNDRRIPDQKVLGRELRAWERRRNFHKATVDWRFTVADARITLKRLYPSMQD